MRISALQAVLIFLTTCAAGADSVLDELQLHRPLIICPLVGWILGDLKTGVIIGGTLEMVVLGWMNVGAAVAPDATLASVVATILVIAEKQSINAGIALAIPVAALGQILTIFARTAVVTLQHLADRFAARGDLSAIHWLHVGALLLQALRVAVPSLAVGFFLGTDMARGVLGTIPEFLSGGLNIAGGLMMTVGYATVMNMMWTGHLIPFFCLGFMISVFSRLNLVALGTTGVILAILYAQLNHPPTSGDRASSTAVAGELDNELD